MYLENRTMRPESRDMLKKKRQLLSTSSKSPTSIVMVSRFRLWFLSWG